jgi:enoyl-CoA hydratase/carnithine racemase
MSDKSLGQKWETTTFTIEKVGHIGVLTYSAPEKLNAGTVDLEHNPDWSNDREEKWWHAFAQVKNDPDINVIVITGEGRAFSAGADLKQWGAMSALAEEKGVSYFDLFGRSGTVIDEGTTLSHEWITRLKKPTIAMVNGLAIGEGADMALMCDIRIMSDQAFFQWAYILRGMVPMDGGMWLLPRLVGRAKALELLLTGNRVYADEALRLGLVNQIVPHDKLHEETMKLAEQIANGPKISVQLTRYCVDAGLNQTLRENLDLGMLCNGLTIETTQEGTKAWGQEKKKPDYKGA